MSDRVWKRRERQVAATFGGFRVGPTGLDDVDVAHPYLAIEVKSRKVLPVWALSCLAQAREARSAAGKIPVAVLIGRGMRVTDGLAVLRVADLQQIVGRIGIEKESA